MSVKVEKIEPPRQARFKIYSNSYDYREFDEKDARAIWEGLAVHFGPAPTSSGPWPLAPGVYYFGRKDADAEITRLRGWLQYFSTWHAAADRALAGDKVTE